MDFIKNLNYLIDNHSNVKNNISRKELIDEVINRKEAFISKSGALATWTPQESTGRSPKDTYIVRNTESEENIDWDAPNNIALNPKTFKLLLDDTMKTLKTSKTIFTTKRVVGAMSDYALPVTTVSNFAITALFTDNVFRAIPKDIDKSCFSNKAFTLLVCP